MQHNLEYNSRSELLIIPEYGRNVQHLVQYAVGIEDEKERAEVAKRIVKLMMQICSPGKNNPELKDKLWKHLFIISDFKINVLPPNGEIPTPEESMKLVQHIPYPKNNKHYRHYGSYVQALIEKAINEADPDKQLGLLNTVASYMKVAYRNWNRDPFVSDDVVISDLKALLKGRIEIPKDFQVAMLYKQTKNSYSKDSGSKRRRPGGFKKSGGKKNNFSRNKKR